MLNITYHYIIGLGLCGVSAVQAFTTENGHVLECVDVNLSALLSVMLLEKMSHCLLTSQIWEFISPVVKVGLDKNVIGWTWPEDGADFQYQCRDSLVFTVHDFMRCQCNIHTTPLTLHFGRSKHWSRVIWMELFGEWDGIILINQHYFVVFINHKKSYASPHL